MQYTLTINNGAEIQALFREAPAKMTREIHTAIAKSLVVLQNAIMREAPVNKQSGGGNLRQSIRSRMTGPAAGEVSTGASYAAYVELGTRPHEIRPKNARVLASRVSGGKAGGEYQIFGTLVHHPGTAPNPFFGRGIQKSNGQIQEYFTQAVLNVLKP